MVHSIAHCSFHINVGYFLLQGQVPTAQSVARVGIQWMN
jgi:hypothetical protein